MTNEIGEYGKSDWRRWIKSILLGKTPKLEVSDAKEEPLAAAMVHCQKNGIDAALYEAALVEELFELFAERKDACFPQAMRILKALSERNERITAHRKKLQMFYSEMLSMDHVHKAVRAGMTELMGKVSYSTTARDILRTNLWRRAPNYFDSALFRKAFLQFHLDAYEFSLEMPFQALEMQLKNLSDTDVAEETLRKEVDAFLVKAKKHSSRTFDRFYPGEKIIQHVQAIYHS